MIAQPERIYMIGAGGHAKVAVRAAQLAGIEVVAIFDDDRGKVDSKLFGVPIVGSVDEIVDQPPLPTLIAIGDNLSRLSIADRYRLPWATIIHPRATVDATSTLAEGVLILAGAVVQADARVGAHVVVNDNATVEHDCFLHCGVHVSCNACLAGGVEVGEGTLIGAAAVVIPGISIGSHAVVGAGASVIHPVADGALAVGVPARTLSPAA